MSCGVIKESLNDLEKLKSNNNKKQYAEMRWQNLLEDLSDIAHARAFGIIQLQTSASF